MFRNSRRDRVPRSGPALVFAAWVAAAAGAQTTYYVNGTCGDDAWTGTSPVCQAPDGPKATIQAGIDASVNGDTVLVADGVYRGAGNINLDYGGRSITVRSEGGPAACTIEGEINARGFYFHSGEDSNARVEGFGIQRFAAIRTTAGGGSGGGIYCSDNSNPTIIGCVITGNFALWNGGGIGAFEASPTIIDCVISGNFTHVQTHTAIGDGGGGIRLRSSQALVIGCLISDNESEGIGGGINVEGGGGATILDCVIRTNHAVRGGGGIVASYGPGLFSNCIIAENVSQAGGGLWSNGPGARPDLVNCTIVRNSAGGGGGVLIKNGSTAMLSNVILWENVGGSGSQGSVAGGGNGPGTLSIAFSCVQDGQAGVFVQAGSRLNWGAGNIAGDPLFLDPGNGDYHVSAGSPCIDAADNWAVPAGILTDLDGNPRFVDDPNTPDTGVPGGAGGSAIVDMGAYEFQVAVFQRGDLNCDGEVDFDDIDPFVLALTGQAAYYAVWPNCNWYNADCNGDGTVDFDDIDPFVALLGG